MKIISKCFRLTEKIFEVTESEGNNSVEFYPQESQKVTHKGRTYWAKLGKVYYDHRVDTLYLHWHIV